MHHMVEDQIKGAPRLKREITPFEEGFLHVPHIVWMTIHAIAIGEDGSRVGTPNARDGTSVLAMNGDSRAGPPEEQWSACSPCGR